MTKQEETLKDILNSCKELGIRTEEINTKDGACAISIYESFEFADAVRLVVIEDGTVYPSFSNLGQPVSMNLYMLVYSLVRDSYNRSRGEK